MTWYLNVTRASVGHSLEKENFFVVLFIFSFPEVQFFIFKGYGVMG